MAIHLITCNTMNDNLLLCAVHLVLIMGDTNVI